jgi:hypothetical protein
MELKKEFESLLKWGLQNPDNKKKVILMTSHLINCLNNTDKKELSKEELNKIAAGLSPATFVIKPL